MAVRQNRKTNVAKKRGRLPVFAERFFILQNGRSNKEMGTFLEISGATVGYYANGDRLPNADDLRNICKKCDVSADWLLGLSDVRKPDVEMKAICEKTGLSEEFIEALSCDKHFFELYQRKYKLLNIRASFLNDIEHSEDSSECFEQLVREYDTFKEILCNSKNFSYGIERPYSPESGDTPSTYRAIVDKMAEKFIGTQKEVICKLGVNARVLFGRELVRYFIFSIKDMFGELIVKMLGCSDAEIDSIEEEQTNLSRYFQDCDAIHDISREQYPES